LKSNYLKYILIVVVVLIYGKIFFDVSDLVGTEEPQMEIQKVVILDKKAISDTAYILKLNYSDPFLKKSIRKKLIVSNKNKSSKKNFKVPLKKQIKAPKVSYKGLVKNNNSSKKTGLVMIDNKSYLVTQNKEYSNIKIISFDNLSLSYVFGGEVKKINK
jgi:hypothetical protein